MAAAGVSTGDREMLRRAVLVPAFLTPKSIAEQDEFLRDFLATEISTEGLVVLQRDGDFGPLKEIFPHQAEIWAQAFAVSPNDCVAFRLQRGTVTAELVLHRQPNGALRVLRANDIRQLAKPLATP